MHECNHEYNIVDILKKMNLTPQGNYIGLILLSPPRHSSGWFKCYPQKYSAPGSDMYAYLYMLIFHI